MKRIPKIRRDKQDPVADFWHTLRVGGVCFLVLLIVLPKIIG